MHSFTSLAHKPLNSVKLFFPTDTQLWNCSWFILVAHWKSGIKGFSSNTVGGLGQYDSPPVSQQQIAKSIQVALTFLLSLFSLSPVSLYHFLSLSPLLQSHAHFFIFYKLPLPSSFLLLRHCHTFFSILLLTCPVLFLFPNLSHCSFPFFPLSTFCSLSFSPLRIILLFPCTFFLSLLLPPCAWSLSRKSAGALIAAPLPDINWRWHLLNTELQPCFCIFPLSECIRRDVTTRKLEAIEEAGSHRDHYKASMKHWRGW